jgi:DNA-binding PadR family transcriptional regulator
MTSREHAILDFLSDEKGKLYSPQEIAAIVSRQGIPTHPSAAAKALRKLVRRGYIQTRKVNDKGAVLLRDLRLLSQGGQQLGTTAIFEYGILDG